MEKHYTICNPNIRCLALPPHRGRFTRTTIRIILVIFFIITASYLFFYKVPADYPINEVIKIESGESLQAITNNLTKDKVIKSPFVFRTLVILLGGEKKIIAGNYLLDSKESPFKLAYRFMNGSFHLEERKITIPEGFTSFQIAEVLEGSLIDFDKQGFIALAQKEEGYLFPDTYFVSPFTLPSEFIARMKDNFEKKIILIPGVSTTTRSLKDIVTMASLLEAEGNNLEGRRMIAGILWRRLDIGMALQVDSTFAYINGKNTYELTLDDLKIDSPYNTYKYPGLPPGAIGNPGVESLTAAVNPIKSDFLYFLSSRNGDMYYAKDFEGHKKNRELYLD